MLAVFEGFAVIAGVILTGFVLGRTGVLGPHGQQVTAKLVFYAGTPALLYVVVSETDLGLIFNTALFATGGSALIVGADRKSTRLNSSHVAISYAVFCLKKKTLTTSTIRAYQ